VLNPVEKHKFRPNVSFDGGDLDCGGGLLFLIRKHLDPLNSGELLEILSTETSVDEELPAWCRLTKNQLVSWTKIGKQRSFLVCKGEFNAAAHTQSESAKTVTLATEAHAVLADPIAPSPVLPIEPLSVMGIGSWPRPQWLLESLHEYLRGRLAEEKFQKMADDCVSLAVKAQEQAGVDVVTDGEQRRDNYASFVAQMLNNCQLVPLTDLLPLVDDPEKFDREMQSLDVPANQVKHPAVYGRISRKRPLAVNEFKFLRSITQKPIKISLPGPYLLTRTMWLDCIPEKAYKSREELAEDIVRILQEEIRALLAAGVSLIQLDEPILTEVVLVGAKKSRSFMCGALSERGDAGDELNFAKSLINRVVENTPPSRLAIHICRGNWTADESVALKGDYHPLIPLLSDLRVGTMFLEFCTPRAGDLRIIKELPDRVRLGIGVVNPKDPNVETVEEVLKKAQAAIDLIGVERIILTPDCGFATFADSPIARSEIAEAKLGVIAKAASRLRAAL
jgi:5-methyltetrahydropteroyltriglutamate--homocysteine methyltransferase